MTKRKKHPNKHIEQAVQYAEDKGWRYKKAGSSAHAWGRLLCPLRNREGCSLSIWSTPRDADVHAEQIYRRIMVCPHVCGEINDEKKHNDAKTPIHVSLEKC